MRWATKQSFQEHHNCVLYLYNITIAAVMAVVMMMMIMMAVWCLHVRANTHKENDGERHTLTHTHTDERMRKKRMRHLIRKEHCLSLWRLIFPSTHNDIYLMNNGWALRYNFSSSSFFWNHVCLVSQSPTIFINLKSQSTTWTINSWLKTQFCK